MQLYVEKVFIAQKTSEDRGGKVRKRVKGTELLVDFTGKGIGGGGRGGKSEEGTDAVAKTHRQTGYNNRAAGEKKKRERRGEK